MSALTRYLKDIVTLEAQLYAQNRIISMLEQRIKPLGYANHYEKPQWHPWKPEIGTYIGGSIWLLAASFIPGTLAVWFVANLLGIFLDWRDFTLISSLRLFFKIFIFVYVIATIYFTYSDIVDVKRKYKKSVQIYHESVRKDKFRVQQELALKTELQNQMQNVISERNKTQSALNAIYGIGIVHPKYRYMVAISAFYDYLDTGRCLSFSGPGGAYATYEEDLRFRRLETKLDVIISKLDDLIANQRLLGELMREANNTLYRIEQSNNRMAQNISRIEENSELIEYNSRCARQSSAVMESIAMYHFLKEDK